MSDYRRGIELDGGNSKWQRLWHFNQRCDSYPARNFVIRRDRPSDDELCARCDSRATGAN
jgi:hypothetical protein